MNIDTYLRYVNANFLRKSWKHLKVLPLDTWIKHPWCQNGLKDYDSIKPIFERDGMYYFQGFCWFEYNGKAWVDHNTEQFLYALKIDDAPIYRESVYKSLKTLQNENMLSDKQKKDLQTFEEYLMLRKIERDSSKQFLHNRKTNNGRN